MSKVVVCIYSRILFSHRKKWNLAICRDVDEPESVMQSEVSQSEKKTNIVIAYMWNPQKWCRWSCRQGRNRDTDMENGPVDLAREGKAGTNWRSSTDICTLPCVKQTASGSCPTAQGAPCSARCCPGGVGGSGGRRCVYTCSRFTLSSSRGKHNVVKPLYSN